MEYPWLGMNCEMQRRRIEKIHTNCKIISSLVSTPTTLQLGTGLIVDDYRVKEWITAELSCARCEPYLILLFILPKIVFLGYFCFFLGRKRREVSFPTWTKVNMPTPESPNKWLWFIVILCSYFAVATTAFCHNYSPLQNRLFRSVLLLRFSF